MSWDLLKGVAEIVLGPATLAAKPVGKINKKLTRSNPIESDIGCALGFTDYQIKLGLEITPLENFQLCRGLRQASELKKKIKSSSSLGRQVQRPQSPKPPKVETNITTERIPESFIESLKEYCREHPDKCKNP